jgi:alpha-tubulin suppressor-like RCC1 family protein
MEGATYCWGGHRLGQLLTPTLPRSGVRLPTRIPGVPPFERLWAGGAHTCGRTPDAKLLCWGGIYALHGLWAQWHTPGPVVSPLAVAVSLVSVGAGESCALQENGEVMCWRVGHAFTEGGSFPEPFDAVDIPGLHEVVALAAGEKHGCARDRGGRVHCWGDREDEPFNGGEEERRRVVRLIPDF